MRHWCLLLLMAALSLALPAMAVDIIDIHQNTSSGIPTMLNQEVTISGIVTSPNYIYSGYNFEIYVQDETAGINVWVANAVASYDADLGDSLTVTARVAQYNGLTEIGTDVAETTIINHGPGSAIPDALVITCADLNSSFHGDFSEPNEGRLIQINDVSIVSGDSWPVFPVGSNSWIDVSDGTGTALLFIDKDTPVNGSPDPGSEPFDVIGILKQYDSSSPYTSGYEISPRYVTDIVTDQVGPLVLGGAILNEVTDTTAEITFATLNPGSSEIEYGLSDSYGNTAGDPLAEVTEHTVFITGLTSGTVYHFRAKSTDDTGTSYGPDQFLITISDVPGEIHVYMSFTADQTYADAGNDVLEMQNLSSRLTTLINQADYSVDAQLYSFSLTNVRDALINAHNRGCLVRLIIDANNSSSYADYCASAGVPYIKSSYGGNHGGDGSIGVMHNKFVVIDARDADPTNDWIWTGSANMSLSGNDDVNNALKIKDFALAQAYTIEFNEMWGSDTQTPNAAEARMGNRKTNNTPHEFSVNGIRIEQYMSPSDGVTDRIVDAIETADHSIYFSILAFTNHNISNAMKYRRDDLGGELDIKGVFDEGLGDCFNGSEYYAMAGDPCTIYAWDVPADVLIDTPLPSSKLLHHKYMVVDPNWVYQDPLVLTGSHNWSFAANSSNDENTLIIHDQGIANKYLQEFAQRYHESGGTMPLGEATAVDDGHAEQSGSLLSMAQNYPNPFNPYTNIAFSTAVDAKVSVSIYDVSGRLVKTLKHDESMGAGYHVIGWDGTDDSGIQVPSGAYLTQIYAVEPINGHNEKKRLKILVLQ